MASTIRQYYVVCSILSMESLALSIISGATVISYERVSKECKTFSKVIFFISAQIALSDAG